VARLIYKYHTCKQRGYLPPPTMLLSQYVGFVIINCECLAHLRKSHEEMVFKWYDEQDKLDCVF